MRQYERIVSYLYEYNKGNKEKNVGYVRMEKRGNTCRILVQMRAYATKQLLQVFLFRQTTKGIRTIAIGKMTARGSNLNYKAETICNSVFQSSENIDNMDGIIIWLDKEHYFSTNWRNDVSYIGDWNPDKLYEKKIEENKSAESVNIVGPKNPPEKEQEREKESKSEESVNIVGPKNLPEKEQESEKESKSAGSVNKADSKKTPEKEQEREKESKSEESVNIVSPQNQLLELQTEKDEINEKEDLQMQSICGICPFKRKKFDYGKRILMTFPSMKPFTSGNMNACVRMELQDIGCLPMNSWSLSGNRFLLHGYYCYRHLIFAQKKDGKYVLGIPGIYSEKEKKNAVRFGIKGFESIGDLGLSQGVFGYWLINLPEVNVSLED